MRYVRPEWIETVNPVPGTDPCDFIHTMRASYPEVETRDWKMPLPGAWMFYPGK
jgi:hypothetical protein